MMSAAPISATVRPVRACLGRDDECAVTVMALMLLRRTLAQEAMRAEHQDQDQDRENDGVGPPGRDKLVAPGGEKADQESAECSSRHVPYPSQNGGGERPQP